MSSVPGLVSNQGLVINRLLHLTNTIGEETQQHMRNLIMNYNYFSSPADADIYDLQFW